MIVVQPDGQLIGIAYLPAGRDKLSIAKCGFRAQIETKSKQANI